MVLFQKTHGAHRRLKMCEPASQAWCHSLMTGHTTHLNTGLELREKLWLPHGSIRQKGSPVAITRVLWSVAGGLAVSGGRSGSGVYCLCSSQALQPNCTREKLSSPSVGPRVILSPAERPQQHSPSPGKQSKQGHLWRHAEKESAQKLWWPRSDTGCHTQIGKPERQQYSNQRPWASVVWCSQSEGLSQERCVGCLSRGQ